MMAYASINNTRLYYETKGEGYPIVFTHGASVEHSMWKPQIECFSSSYKTIAWDVRGHGRSEMPEGAVDSRDFTKDLIGLLDHLEIETPILCGLSMGGHISLQTAALYRDRVKGLILIGTPYSNATNLMEKLMMPLNRFCNRIISTSTLGKMQGTSLSKFNKDNKKYFIHATSYLDKKKWDLLWQAISRMESRELLEKIDCPTLVLEGDHDNLTGRQQPYICNHIKNVEYHTINKAQHLTNRDNPAEVNSYIQAFLDKVLKS